MEELINGYDDLNVDEVREEIDKRPLSRTNLREIRAYERENKDRVTVTRYIDDLLGDKPVPGPETAPTLGKGKGPDAGKGNGPDSGKGKGPDGGGSDNPDEGGSDNPDEGGENGPDAERGAVESGRDKTVTVTPQRSGHIAGHFFDYSDTRREVVHNARIKDAIERGLLEVVE